MSYLAADGAALVAAAVQAAIRERAPRRTVAAVAAAVTGTLVSAAARPCVATKPKVCTQDAQSAAGETDDPAQLLETLRAVRRTQRKKKKERRRAAKLEARDNSDQKADVADQSAQIEGTVAAVSAMPDEITQPSAASAVQSGPLRSSPGVNNVGEPDDDGSSSCHTMSMVGGSVVSAGRQRQSPYAKAAAFPEAPGHPRVRNSGKGVQS